MIVWLSDPKILMDKRYITHIWPKSPMSPEEKLNAITRLIIILSHLGYLITNDKKIFIIGFIALAVYVFLYTSQQKTDKKERHGLKIKEAFTNPQTYNKYKDHFTIPNKENPVMNVLLPEIKYDPQRKPAAPAYNPQVEKEINQSTIDFVESNLGGKDIDKKLFTSLGDSFNFEVGAMNRFYANPSTTIPNDQHGFTEFCYGNMQSCKDGDILACSKNPPRIGAVVG